MYSKILFLYLYNSSYTAACAERHYVNERRRQSTRKKGLTSDSLRPKDGKNTVLYNGRHTFERDVEIE